MEIKLEHIVIGGFAIIGLIYLIKDYNSSKIVVNTKPASNPDTTYSGADGGGSSWAFSKRKKVVHVMHENPKSYVLTKTRV